MKAAIRALTLPPVSGFIALLILVGALLWLNSAFLFTGTLGLILIIAGLVLLWAAGSGFWMWRRRRRSAQMAEAIVEEPDQTGELISAEERELQAKFATAVKDLSKLRLKGSTGRSRYLYELPWYIFIGPPAAGKTEALDQSGLTFPLRRAGERIDIEGGAGTRNCNWVFTNDAVFIDTAGRYTTQSSDETVDAAAWSTFLDLLRKHRPREPINGVIVAISLDDLAAASDLQIDERAEAIRARLKELCERMDARIPVYVMFTKADLLVGFNEFFQTLRAEERRQVWGTTFPLREDLPSDTALHDNLENIGTEFDALVAQLGEIQFRHLREEPDLSVRAKVFSFPAQFSSMKPVVERFLRRAFDPNSYTDPVLLRGFYFTSATQVGQPVDRLVASLARDFGIERQAVPASAASGRSYFLTDLLSRVVFPEAGLVSTTTKERAPLLRYAAIAACVLLPLAIGGALWSVHHHNHEEAERLDDALGNYRAATATITTDFIDNGSVHPVLPALDILGEEAARLDAVKPPVPFGLGVDRVPLLARRAGEAYDQALDDLLRPRLMYRFEREIARTLDDQGALYQALKAYLLIAGADGSRLQDNKVFLQRRIAASLGETYNTLGDRPDMLRLVGEDGLGGHVAALLARDQLTPWRSETDPGLDGELVTLARDRLDISPAERALQAMIAGASIDLPDWSIAEEGGRSLANALIDSAGGVPDRVIPALFTHRGFHEYFLENAVETVKAIREEEWVTADPDDSRVRDAEIVDDLARLYDEAYIDHWRGVLSDLRIKPFSDAESANAVLGALVAHSASPLRRILDQVIEQTAVDVAPEGDEVSGVIDAAGKEGGRVGRDAASGSGILGRILVRGLTDRDTGEAQAPGARIVEAFADLRDYGDGEGIDALMEQLGNFRRAVASAEARGDTRPLSTTDAALDLKATAANVPDPLDDMLAAMIGQADMTSSQGARARINEIWKSTVYPRCSRGLHDRYPFGGREPVSLGDLGAVLGPQGTLETFFNQHLRALVDLTTWQWRPAGLALGIPAERLAFFRDADTLRRAFFAAGGNSPGFEMSIRLRPAEAGVQETRVAIGGSPAAFGPTDRSPRALLWPGPQSALGAEIALTLEPATLADEGLLTTPQPRERQASISQSGSWGLFKLVDKLGYRPVGNGASGRIRAVIEGRLVVVELGLGTVENPFTLKPTIRRFACPGTL